MGSNDQLEIFVKISSQIGELTASIQNVLGQLQNHEHRLQSIEGKTQNSFKDQIIILLVKALVIGGVALAGLTGGAGILSKIFS